MLGPTGGHFDDPSDQKIRGPDSSHRQVGRMVSVLVPFLKLPALDEHIGTRRELSQFRSDHRSLRGRGLIRLIL
jgi:hypothetical protein